MSGGSVKISSLVVVDSVCGAISSLVMSKLGKTGWYCVTKGNILLRASLFFCLSDAFLSLNFTPVGCFDPANNGQTGYINLQKIILLLSEFPVATDSIPGRIETTVLPQNLHFNHARNPHC